MASGGLEVREKDAIYAETELQEVLLLRILPLLGKLLAEKLNQASILGVLRPPAVALRTPPPLPCGLPPLNGNQPVLIKIR